MSAIDVDAFIDRLATDDDESQMSSPQLHSFY
jgi:hypothetical protein